MRSLLRGIGGNEVYVYARSNGGITEPRERRRKTSMSFFEDSWASQDFRDLSSLVTHNEKITTFRPKFRGFSYPMNVCDLICSVCRLYEYLGS